MTIVTKKLLLTGATGVLGPSLIKCWGPDRIVALVHRTSVTNSEVACVAGDVRRPRFGLAEREYQRLLDGLDGIVHAAAVTSVARRESEIEETNITGTSVAIAAAAQANVPLHHISTFYVRGRGGSHEIAAENAYQSSKRTAEELVRAAEVPWSVLRLPLLIGDTQTGATTRFQGIYVAAKAIVAGNAHIVPAEPGSRVDFLPRDYVARCVTTVVDAGLTGEHWIAAGQRALPIEEYLDACIETAAAIGRTIPKPKLVPPERVKRLFMPAFGDAIGRELHAQLRMAVRVMAGLAIDTPLPDLGSTLPDGVAFPEPPNLASALRVSLRYWIKHARIPEPAIMNGRPG